MPYNATPILFIDLGDMGEDTKGEGFYLKIKNPKLLTFNDKKTMSRIVANASEDDDSRFDSSLDYFRSMITETNLEEVETGNPINLNDTEALYKIPMEVITRIGLTIKPPKKEVDDVKN